jgi:hypothetical protein
MTHEPSTALPGASFWWRATVLVLAHPGLWWTALRQGMRLARRRWWATAPFLPLPDADYLRFRFETQYGADGRPDPHDLLEYLVWCQRGDSARRAQSIERRQGPR